MHNKIVISKQFCGPTDSGNGGYTCGLLASYIQGPAQVTLKLPPPLDEAMTVMEDSTAGGVILTNGSRIIAEAVPAVVDLIIPNPPTLHEATRAEGNHPMMNMHIYNCCFVCGPERKPADGLRIFAGIVENNDYVAAPWVPDPCFANESGIVRNEIVWAALDCPGAWAALTDGLRPILLGRLAADIIRPVYPGQQLVVMGWKINQEGRKTMVGTALFDEQQQLCAKAQATWIQLKS